MNAADTLRVLLEAAVAVGAAIVLAMLLRAPLRRWAGAGMAYAVWWVVPATLVAGWLPAATQAPMPAPVRAFVLQVTPSALTHTSTAAVDWPVWWLTAWLLGAVLRVVALIGQQRRFRRRLGALTLRADGMHQAQSIEGLPAVVGWWSPRIVVPSDFDHRYHAQERALMQAHERAHVVHGDLLINAVVALLRCLFWFHPLLPWAARAFRHDQELACDQRVIARHPQARRAYGEAMFKTQLASQPLPLGCHWGFSHPLKERIAMLNKPLPSGRRLLAGTTCVLALALACGYAAWAAQPARAMPQVPANKLRVDTTLRIDGAASVTQTRMAEKGRTFVLRQTANGHDWEIIATVGSTPHGMHTVGAVITRDRQFVAAPRIELRPGDPGRIQIGEDTTATGGGFEGIELDVTVSGPVVRDTTPPTLQIASVAFDASQPVQAAPVREAAEPASAANLPAPSYPREALDRKLDGTVVLEIDMDATGKVTAVSVLNSDPAGVFDAAAIEAAWKWRFDPLIEDGKPVAGRVHVPVRFEHDKAAGGGMART